MKDRKVFHLFVTHGFASMSGSLLNALYFLIDAMLIGQWVGAQGLAAVSACFPILLLVSASGQVIIRGASALYSESLGAGDEHLMARIWPAFIRWGMLVPLVFAIGVALSAREFLSFILGPSPETVELGISYLRIYAFNYILITLNLGLVGFLRCEGRSLSVTLLFAATTFINLSLDYLFLAKLGWGLESAALASTIANLLATFGGLALLSSSQLIRRSVSDGSNFRLLRLMFNRGGYTLVMHLLIIIQQATLYSLAGKGSEVALVAVMGATLNIQNFVVSPMFGLSLSLQSILGLAYGARDSTRISEVFRTYMVLTSAVCVLLGLGIISQNERILMHFVNDPAIVQSYLSYFTMGILGVLTYGSLVIGMIYLQTLNRVKDVIQLILGRFLLQMLLAISLWFSFGSQGLFISLFVADLLSLLLTIRLILRSN